MTARNPVTDSPARSDADRAAHAAYMRDWRRGQRLRKGVTGAAAKALARQAVTAPDMAAALEWIGDTLKVPSGPLAGRPFVIEPWQAEWLLAASQTQIREAGLSIARKNGKSGVIAAVLLAHLLGPLNRWDWRGVVTSLTGPLALELRTAIEGTAKMSGIYDQLRLVKSPPPGQLWGLNDAHVRFLAADKATGHAIGADHAIIDEAGLLQENQRALWNALKSSISGRNGKFWCISIQGDGPMFAEMEAKDGARTVHWKRCQADPQMDISDPAAWHAANPGLASGIKSIEYMQDQADHVAVTPGDEAHFRAYDLNQSVDPHKESIVSVGEYMKCVTDAPPKLGAGGDIVVGLDLGGSVSMTSGVALDPANGAMLVRGAFGDDPPLSQRAKADRVGTRYDVMVRRGELRLYPGRITPMVPFIRDFFEEVSSYGRVVVIGCDRFRKAELEQALSDAGIPSHVGIVFRGQGAGATADGTRDVREFQKAIRAGRYRLAESPMLELAIASSVLRYDGAGNPALDKRHTNARIDALSAAVIAAGLGASMPDTPLMRLSVV